MPRFLFPSFYLIKILAVASVLAVCVQPNRAAAQVKATLQKGDAADALNLLFAEGLAAGNVGIFYDNRDRAHANFPVQNYPGLQRITYTEQEKAQRLDVGLANRILPQVTIGNCSMASAVTQVGSLPRVYYGDPQGMKFLFTQYVSNNIYVYPEHQDHDPGINGSPGYGDVFPTNSPYLIISQGSSYSDLPFVDAMMKSLSAMRPEVRARIVERRMVAPVLQYLLRSNYGTKAESFDYLSGQAHPTVFDKQFIRDRAMVDAANSLKIETLPPMIHLGVVEEDTARPGIDFFEPDELNNEVISDTNCVISRIYRTRAPQRRMVVSARQTMDMNNLPLTYHWVLLRGDPKRVRITPSADGGSAEIIVAYHSRQPIEEGGKMVSNRVDIGVFAHNGHHFSAPGFVTTFTLANEDRVFGANGGLIEIYYGARAREFEVLPPNPATWLPMLYSFQDGGHPQISPILRAVLKPKDLAVIDDKFDDLAEKYREMVDLRKRATERISGLEAKEKEAKSSFAQMQKKVKSGEVEATQVEAAKQIADMATAARRAVQPEVDVLRQQANQLSTQIINGIQHLEGGRSVQTSVRQAIDTVLNDPLFYLRNRTALDVVGKESGRDGGAINRAVNDLVSLAVLARSGRDLTLPGQMKSVPPNSFHHLRQLNLMVAQKLLFPGVIQRPDNRNFVDARMSAPKLWRDIYHYGDDGKINGWTRMESGKALTFSADGRLLRPDGGSTAVSYQIDPKTKRLKAVPQ